MRAGESTVATAPTTHAAASARGKAKWRFRAQPRCEDGPIGIRLTGMLKWFRSSARVWALLVLWSFTALGMLSATVHSATCGDELSSVSDTGHFSGAHHALRTPQTREAPTHCVLCHWMQSFRAAGVRVSRIVMAQTPVAPAPGSAVQHTRAAARLELPPRAPPA
jgi:hypothetical protein